MCADLDSIRASRNNPDAASPSDKEKTLILRGYQVGRDARERYQGR